MVALLKACTIGLSIWATGALAGAQGQSGGLARPVLVEDGERRPLGPSGAAAATASGALAGGGIDGFADVADGPEVSGRPVAWHPLTLTFRGPFANEFDLSPNPFLDFRMTVVFFGPSGQLLVVPGFFHGDGEGGGSGDRWSARFVPSVGGTWFYRALFHAGANIAIDLDLNHGTPGGFHGTQGSLSIGDTDPSAEGFHRWGRLEHTGTHYLKFREGPYFLKGGTHGPENLLGYRGFDNTVNQPGGADDSGLIAGLHSFQPHWGDFVDGDTFFVSEDTGYGAKGIVGALNYLASRNVNSIRLTPLNLGGGGRDSYPFLRPMNTDFDKTHYDVSKLEQWNQLFEHATKKRIMLHFVLAETELESELYLDGGSLGVQRKLFFRELVARFSHCLAIKWDLSEENDFSLGLLGGFADYLRALDPYDHPVAFQSRTLTGNGDYAAYSSAVFDPRYSVGSVRGTHDAAGAHVERWRQESAAAGQPWVLDHDVQTPAHVGLGPENTDYLRRATLYDVYFSGGNIEWNLGRRDLGNGGGQIRLEDFRTRAGMWNDMRTARLLMQQMPFWAMSPADHLLNGESPAFGGGEVFHLPNQLYAVYLPSATSTGTLDLSGTTGTFRQVWFNPRTGAFEGGTQFVSGGGPVALGAPPGTPVSGAYLESNGLAVVEFESLPPAGDWVAESIWSGFAGASYNRWNGPNQFSSPGHGTIQFQVQITNPGTYNFRIHNRHNAPVADAENDCWLQVNGTGWNKVYSNQGAASIATWNWSTRFEFSGLEVTLPLGPGVHTFEVSGRSHGFMMDRVHLYLDSVPNPQSLSHPESAHGGGTGGADEDWVVGFVK